MRLLSAALIVILGCSLSVGAAISEIFQNSNPQVAAASWPKNGFALNAVVDGKLSEYIANTDKKAVSAQQWLSIGNQALAAFRDEPLNASALRSLALAAEANGDTIRANTLMANAVKFSRHDTAANNWQFIQALKSQDLTRSLQLVDRILRENNALRSQYLPVLIAGVAQPEGYAAIYPMLAKQPQWEAEFWTKAASQLNLPAELGAMRQRLLEHRGQKTPIVPFLVADIRLIQNLVRSGEFDAAQSLHSYLANQKQQSAGSNARAIAATDFTAYDSALDWQLTSRGDVQAYLNDTGRQDGDRHF